MNGPSRMRASGWPPSSPGTAKVIFDTPHPVAQRADLAAMIGTSRVMMYRTLRELEADGLVKRQRGGGINILDKDRLAGLVTVATPDGAPAL